MTSMQRQRCDDAAVRKACEAAARTRTAHPGTISVYADGTRRSTVVGRHGQLGRDRYGQLELTRFALGQ